MIRIDLTGKTALVTGASRGLGAVTVEALYQAGANVAINYFNDADGKNRIDAESLVSRLGSETKAFPGDVRDEREVAQLIEKAVERFGTLDIVVNNAGIIRDKTLKKMSITEWRDVVETNLTGTFNVCRAAAEKIARKGRVINVSSISGAVGFFGQSNYAASKAGVVALTKVLSKELGKMEVTVNAIAPGVVLTEMGKSIPDEVRTEMLKSIPLGRFGTSREIANVVLFLCSELASYINGQVIHINGGWYG